MVENVVALERSNTVVVDDAYEPTPRIDHDDCTRAARAIDANLVLEIIEIVAR